MSRAALLIVRPVNTVFQDYALFPHMSVAENVAYGLRVNGVKKRERLLRAREALEMVRLPDVGDRRPLQLSGGQRQRVALARALVNRPRVLLLDEPLGALDLKLRQQMQLELKSIQRELRDRITFVYVTHDQDEALTMSDRVAVFSDGRDRADRHAGGDLRAPRQRVRRGLRRHLKHHRARWAPLHGSPREDSPASGGRGSMARLSRVRCGGRLPGVGHALRGGARRGCEPRRRETESEHLRRGGTAGARPTGTAHLARAGRVGARHQPRG